MKHIPGHYKCRMCKIAYKTIDELSDHYQKDTKSHIDWNNSLVTDGIPANNKLWETNGRDEFGRRPSDIDIAYKYREKYAKKV